MTAIQNPPSGDARQVIASEIADVVGLIEWGDLAADAVLATVVVGDRTVADCIAIARAVLAEPERFPHYVDREVGEWSGTVETYNDCRQEIADSRWNQGWNDAIDALRVVKA